MHTKRKQPKNASTCVKTLVAVSFVILFGGTMCDGPLLAQQAVEPLVPELGTIDDEEVDDFLDLDIEQLRNTSVAPALEAIVTSVSRQESTIGRSPAAIFVITNEMIRRSGANSIPESLRMAPGLHVAKLDSSKWAITSRGFNGRFANKLLVQIDGRSVYTPVFAGVYWDTQDLLLEDVERIEVVRGPGATMWGSNAVNGVINIITKRASDTTGAYVRAGGGTEEADFAGARIGGQAAGGDVHWRAWGKWLERDRGFRPEGPTFDNWRQGRGGMRVDWTPTGDDILTLQGDIYDGLNGEAKDSRGVVTPRTPSTVQGGDLLARWTHVLDDDSDWSLQTYFDRTHRANSTIDQAIDTVDIDFQHRFPLGARHSIIWGVGYRNAADNLISPTGSTFSFTPSRRRMELIGGFVQDEISLIEDALFVTIGTKVEDNAFTNFEIQPSARLLWSLDAKRAVWGAVSRAVRIPSRILDDVRVALGGPISSIGSRNVVAEELLAYEIGYRAQPVEWFSWDAACFYNDYNNLSTRQFAFPNLVFNNDMRGESYGFELTGQLDLTSRWRLSASYTFLRLHLHPGLTSANSGTDTEGGSPRNQARLWSSWDLGRNWQFDAIARYADDVPAKAVPHYITMDLRLAWDAGAGLEVAVVGQNLLDAAHKEYGPDGSLPQFTEVQRGVYGYAAWRY